MSTCVWRCHAPLSYVRINQEDDEMNQQNRTPITDVRTVGVPVTDQDRALEFYLDKLGFESAWTLP
jgi:hypothetical protein